MAGQYTQSNEIIKKRRYQITQCTSSIAHAKREENRIDGFCGSFVPVSKSVQKPKVQKIEAKDFQYEKLLLTAIAVDKDKYFHQYSCQSNDLP